MCPHNDTEKSGDPVKWYNATEVGEGAHHLFMWLNW